MEREVDGDEGDEENEIMIALEISKMMSNVASPT